MMGYHTVPLQVFFKPIHTEVSFRSKMFMMEENAENLYGPIIIKNDWYEFYEQKMSMSECKRLTVVSVDGAVNSVEIVYPAKPMESWIEDEEPETAIGGTSQSNSTEEEEVDADYENEGTDREEEEQKTDKYGNEDGYDTEYIVVRTNFTFNYQFHILTQIISL
ncbi:hypothetical protein CAEBREN_05993 [Caenorhabditis brenneri]|uniref:Uncharacterized protein n=1 Tax=Caenorhabditis brenneri TaxID=135651 RepID=G0NX07_CAEBE|nr:hypothetical protein CAEBREN_05993 [Caenorhabditis brenneri]